MEIRYYIYLAALQRCIICVMFLHVNAIFYIYQQSHFTICYMANKPMEMLFQEMKPFMAVENNNGHPSVVILGSYSTAIQIWIIFHTGWFNY